MVDVEAEVKKVGDFNSFSCDCSKVESTVVFHCIPCLRTSPGHVFQPVCVCDGRVFCLVFRALIHLPIFLTIL